MRGLNHIYFCRNSNLGGDRGRRSRKGRASSTPKRSAVGGRGTYAFFFSLSRFLSSFPFPPSSFRWFAGSPRGGRRRQVGEEGRAPAPSRFGSGAVDGPHALRVARGLP